MNKTSTPGTVSSKRRIAVTFTSILTLGALLAPQAANAQPAATFPYQSFVDNFVSPKSPLDYVPVLGSEVVSFAKGSLDLSSTDSRRWLALGKVAKNGEDIVAEDTSMRVVVRCSDASGLGLWTRDGFFVCNLLPPNQDVPQWQLKIADWWGYGQQASVNIDGNLADQDVVVEFDTIGSTLTARAWELENPANVYEISWPEEADVWTGTLGIGALGYTEPGAPAPVVSYYQFKLKIIPPTSNRH